MGWTGWWRPMPDPSRPAKRVYDVVMKDGTHDEIHAHRLSTYTSGLLEFENHDFSHRNWKFRTFFTIAPGEWKTVERQDWKKS